MTTTARSAPTLEVTTAADIMDLHSDSGLDFGDGDIDLDLQSTGPHDGDEDDNDVSLYDAGTELGPDAQTASADQDDFMADHEDLIEDNLVIYDNAAVDEIDQRSAGPRSPEQQAPLGREEDLIDYSDDEEEHVVNDPTNASNSIEAQVDSNVPAESTHVEEHNEANDEGADAVADEPPANEVGADNNQQDADDDYGDTHEQRYLDETVDQQPEQNVYADADADADTAPQAEGPNETSLSGDAHQQEVFLHQVTVNYNDVELWLFKRHDLDDSGDYLLDDDLPTNKPISNLLDACRSALGSITDNMEVGLRLDSFNNIELWQEHSSCAFVTLEDLVSLYLQLHAQDGTTDPESFYMTLLFRPRVSALISELRKAAADGIGHSGLRGAIDAGQTAFSVHLSHDSTEHHDNWENEERQQEGDSYGTNRLSADGEHDDEYHEDQNEKDRENFDQEYDGEHHEEPYEQNSTDQASQPPVQSPKMATPESGTGSTSDGSAGGASRTSNHDESKGSVVQALAHESPSSLHPSPGEEEDLLDYSDDEDAEAAHTNLAQAHQPSSSSSTVQGDEKSDAGDNVQGPGDHEDYTEDAREATYDYQNDEANGTFAQDEPFDYSNGFTIEGFGEYSENEEADNEEYGDTQEFEGYPTTHATEASDENTNHYDDLGDQNVDLPADLTGDDGNNAAESTVVEDDFTGVDSLLDFDAVDAIADVSTHDQAGRPTEDLIDFDDDADGEDGEAPVAASAAADPIVSSSSGLQNLSPSGQKRKIDEAGNDEGEATDSTDAKRPRV